MEPGNTITVPNSLMATNSPSSVPPAGPQSDVVALSAMALRAARAGTGDDELDSLASLTPGELRDGLLGDAEKLAFWINVYNAGIQYLLRRDPGAYGRKWRFFASAGVTIAGRRLSFNAIEHGMLRRSRFGYSLGYLSNPLPNGFERQFRLERPDPRIHFALNCGAASCPPISTYFAESIDAQLDLAAGSYVESECRYDPGSNIVTVPRLFFWFHGDFGGRRGTVEFLRRYAQLPPAVQPRVKYGPYDWTLAMG